MFRYYFQPAALAFLFAPLGAFAGEPYTGPWNMQELVKPPKTFVGKQDGNVTWLYYDGESYQGKPTRVFAYLAMPEKRDGKLPAMVLVHGGGGTAFLEWAQLWAKRGYVALAMDLAGQGPGRKRDENAGPPQSGAARFDVAKLKDYWSYHAVAAVIRGVSLLAARPEVDPKRIGITGISWGGYLTCIVAGLDQRLKVAVPVYGCGFIHENSAWNATFRGMPPVRRKLWVSNFEPSRYVGQAKMPVLFVNGTNDFAYPLDSYQKTYRLVKNRTLCVRVRMPHSHPAGWAPKDIGLFVDAHLKSGTPFAVVTATRENGKAIVRWKSESKIKSAALHYTTDSGVWQKRVWHTQPAQIDGDTATAVLPVGRPLTYYMSITDERGALVSTEHGVVK